MAYNMQKYRKEVREMKTTKIKVLVSILRESSLYQTISHEEKLALISKLLNDYPSLANDQT
jgi:hypothetical protein